VNKERHAPPRRAKAIILPILRVNSKNGAR